MLCHSHVLCDWDLYISTPFSEVFSEFAPDCKTEFCALSAPLSDIVLLTIGTFCANLLLEEAFTVSLLGVALGLIASTDCEASILEAVPRVASGVLTEACSSVAVAMLPFYLYTLFEQINLNVYQKPQQ